MNYIDIIFFSLLTLFVVTVIIHGIRYARTSTKAYKDICKLMHGDNCDV